MWLLLSFWIKVSYQRLGFMKLLQRRETGQLAQGLAVWQEPSECPQNLLCEAGAMTVLT